jgi:hypothetical protein
MRRTTKPFPLAGPGVEYSHLTVKGFVRNDFDGLKHLDIFHPDVFPTNMVSTFDRTEFLEPLQAFIVKILGIERKERIRAKYLWLARYYNSTPGATHIPLS